MEKTDFECCARGRGERFRVVYAGFVGHVMSAERVFTIVYYDTRVEEGGSYRPEETSQFTWLEIELVFVCLAFVVEKISDNAQEEDHRC